MRTIYNTSDKIYTDSDLESAVHHAYMLGLHGSMISPKIIAKEWSDEVWTNTRKELTLDAIVEAVSLITGIPVDNILIRHYKTGTLAFSRMLLSWFAYMYTDICIEDIMIFNNYKHHSSILHGVKTINQMLQYDKKNILYYIDSIKSKIIYDGYGLKITARPMRDDDDGIEFITIK